MLETDARTLGADFESTCIAQFKGSERAPGLLQDSEDGHIKFLRLPIILQVEHSEVVMTAGSQSGGFQFETYGEPIFNSCFMQFVFRIIGVIKL